MSKSNHVLSLALFLALSATLAPSFAETAPPAATVFGKSVTSELYSDELTYPARVVPKINSNVLADTDGVVTKIPAVLGQKVSARQTLIVITHTDPVYQFAPMKVASPISGVVSAINVAEGSQVNKGEKLASVTDPRKLRVVIEVPAEDLDSLKKGIPAEFRISGRPDPIAVKLQGMSPFVDPSTGTATCEFDVDPVHASLSPGIVGRIIMSVHQRKGIRIPEYAILYRGQSPYARIYENGKVRYSTLKLGKKQEGFVEILSGLKDKDMVIERASRFVADGESVQLDPGSQANQGAQGHSS
ncbi:MAG: efflux RND transporter periplasmic adaptor subunit [Bdellovibrionia bacterium]